MRVIACLSWFDEPPPLLALCIHGLAQAADHLVAVDGAYALYPDAVAASPLEQHAVVNAACREYGLALTTLTPRAPWEGNETQKRTALFDLAHAVSDPGDWFLVVDADEIVTGAPTDLRDRLAATEHPAGDVRIVDTVAARADHPSWPAEHDARRLFRAQPIRVEGNHYTYLAADGMLLFDGNAGRQVPGARFPDLIVEHRPAQRPIERLQSKRAYYATRDEARVERGLCERCDEPAVVRMPARWERGENGIPVSQLAELCERHATQASRTNHRRLTSWGINPTQMAWRERYAPPAVA